MFTAMKNQLIQQVKSKFMDDKNNIQFRKAAESICKVYALSIEEDSDQRVYDSFLEEVNVINLVKYPQSININSLTPFDQKPKECVGLYNNVPIWYTYNSRMNESNGYMFGRTLTIRVLPHHAERFERHFNKHILKERTRGIYALVDHRGLGSEDTAFRKTYEFPLDLATQQQLITPENYASIDGYFEGVVSGRIPKATILLAGPPGTGKSNVVTHMAAKYDINIIKAENPWGLKVAYSTLKDNILGTKPVVLLLEDIDSNSELCKPTPFNYPEGSRASLRQINRPQLSHNSSYSTFINWLNGVDPLKNVIIVLSSNYIEKLYPSLYRMGRVDEIITIGYPTFDETIKYMGIGDQPEKLKLLHDAGQEGNWPVAGIVSIRENPSIENIKKNIHVREESLKYAADDEALRGIGAGPEMGNDRDF